MNGVVLSEKEKRIVQHELVVDVLRLYGIEFDFLENMLVFSQNGKMIHPVTINRDKEGIKLSVNVDGQSLRIAASTNNDPSLGNASVCSIEVRKTKNKDQVTDFISYSVEHSFEKDPDASRISFRAYKPKTDRPYLSFTFGTDTVQCSNNKTMLNYKDKADIFENLEALGNVSTPTSETLFTYIEFGESYAHYKRKIGVSLCKFMDGEIRPYFHNTGFRDYPEAMGHGIVLDYKKLKIAYDDFSEKILPNDFLFQSLQEAELLCNGTMDLFLNTPSLFTRFKPRENPALSYHQRKF